MKLNILLVVCLLVFGVLETVSAYRKRARKHHRHHGSRPIYLPYGPPGVQRTPLNAGPPGWVPNVHSPERYLDRVVGPPASKLASMTDVGHPAVMDVKPPGVKPANSPSKLGKLVNKNGPPAHMRVGPPASSSSSVVGPPADNYGPPGSNVKADNIIGPPAGPPGGLTHQDMQSLEPGCPPGESTIATGGCVPMSQSMRVACPPGSNPDFMGIGCMPNNAVIDMDSYRRRVHGNSDPMGPSPSSIVGRPSGK